MYELELYSVLCGLLFLEVINLFLSILYINKIKNIGKKNVWYEFYSIHCYSLVFYQYKQ